MAFSQKQSNSGPLPMQRKKPKRPMTAYNFFFQDEHRRIKDEIEAAEAAAEAAEEAKARAAGEEPPKKKSRRRKKISPREKLGFEDLGKLIGRRWKEIKESDLAEYKRRAAEDAERYKAESEAYYKGQIDAMCMGYNNSKEGAETGEQQGNPSDVTQVPTAQGKKRKKLKNENNQVNTDNSGTERRNSETSSTTATSSIPNKNEDTTGIASPGLHPNAVFSFPPAAGNPSTILPFQLNQTLAGNPMFLQAQLQQFQAPRQQQQLSTYADLIQAQVQMQQQQQQQQQNQFAQLMAPQMLQLLQAQQQQAQPIASGGTTTTTSNDQSNLINAMFLGSILGQQQGGYAGADANANNQ